MCHYERQLFCDYLWKEFYRHKDDMKSILADLKHAHEHYGITPRRVYVGTRIEVSK
jgi:poly(3-hydroxybutyrate) depolymerase